jgi:hypothetical protein
MNKLRMFTVAALAAASLSVGGFVTAPPASAAYCADASVYLYWMAMADFASAHGASQAVVQGSIDRAENVFSSCVRGA